MMSFETYCLDKHIKLTPKQKAFADFLMEKINGTPEAVEFMTVIGIGTTTVLQLLERYYKNYYRP